MRRPLLVVAMLVSLWPVAVIANAAIAGASGSSNASSDTGSSTPAAGSAPSGPQPDYAGLNSLHSRENQLLQRLHNSKSLHGVADNGLAQAADQLAVDFRSWESANTGLDVRADKVESLEATVAQRVAAFAAHPSQGRLNDFNRAVSAYNANVRATGG